MWSPLHGLAMINSVTDSEFRGLSTWK